MKSLPKTCQGFLMSATLSPELNKLKHVVLHSPAVLKLEEDEGGVDASGGADGYLMQYYLDLPSKDKFLVMYVFLKVSSGKLFTSRAHIRLTHLFGTHSFSLDCSKAKDSSLSTP
jgi:superfamily II DNA/RNA helicase